MSLVPQPVAKFLRSERIAVAGVSRNPNATANAVFKKLRDNNYEVIPVNPNASEVEGVRCFPNLLSIPEPVDGVVVATHPKVSLDIVRQCREIGIKQIWFHRSFGSGSTSAEALEECQAAQIEYIEGGCPLMFCEPVDVAHKCMRWWLQKTGKVPT